MVDNLFARAGATGNFTLMKGKLHNKNTRRGGKYSNFSEQLFERTLLLIRRCKGIVDSIGKGRNAQKTPEGVLIIYFDNASATMNDNFVIRKVAQRRHPKGCCTKKTPER